MHQPTRNNFQVYLIALLAVISSLHCAKKEEPDAANKSLINTTHLDGLYEERAVNGDTVGIVHIYSEFPDYKWKGDDDEGDACVDDASRAAIFYLRQFQKTSEVEYLRKGKMLIKFLLAMQAPNGYYYNFLWPDGRIHTDGITSKPEPNFWSWRVLWAFGEAVAILPSNDPLVSEINQQREKLVNNILAEPQYRTSITDTTLGWTFPTWLPKISGTDQASIIMIGLSAMLQQMPDSGSITPDSLVSFMEHCADGITMMQIEQPDSLQDGAFLSWENLWHAYANIQSYALLMAGEAINDQHMISHAMYELDHFYPAVLKAGGLESFFVKIEDGKLSRFDTKSFSQIAYGRRPMIWAAVKAYQMTKDEKYLSLAKELSKWFSGDNPAQAVMYDPDTGRGYDGISNSEQINKNAGAESTIEALLALQVMEEYK
ncbi:MAG: hypothetical protein ABIQ11_08960 [Saprospiraceae bacterium]